MNVFVIGGGASGLSRAVCRANKGHRVTIIERASAIGKKLLATGNGRCNYYNSDQGIEHYHSYNREKLTELINEKNLEELKRLYESVGIVPLIKDGYWYPRSQQAVNVLNCFKRNADALGVKFITDTEIRDIRSENGKFILNDKFCADRVIICTGSQAYYKKEKCLTYDMLKGLGHSVYEPKPALVQMTSQDKILKVISGVRVNGSITIYDKNGFDIRTQSGEIQFTDYGISGICTMILSREYKEKSYVTINLVGNMTEEFNEFRKFFKSYGKTQDCTAGEILDAVMNYKLSNAVCTRAGVHWDTPYKKLTKDQVDAIVKNAVSFRLDLTGTKGFDQAQTVCGGVPLTEISLGSMESKRAKGLYMCGESIDVDGDCGGYNLTVAFLTGMIAGKSV